MKEELHSVRYTFYYIKILITIQYLLEEYLTCNYRIKLSPQKIKSKYFDITFKLRYFYDTSVV